MCEDWNEGCGLFVRAKPWKPQSYPSPGEAGAGGGTGETHPSVERSTTQLSENHRARASPGAEREQSGQSRTQNGSQVLPEPEEGVGGLR